MNVRLVRSQSQIAYGEFSLASQHPYRRTPWTNAKAPDLATFEALASETFAQLPNEVLMQCGHVQISLAEYADDDVLNALGIEDPSELLGLFEGSGLAQDGGSSFTGKLPNRIWLFRRPILDYWASGEETLGDIVAHVLIHEIGHHFGLSDEDMERIEEAADVQML